MNVSVLWSGGVDSTLALYNAATNGWVKWRQGKRNHWSVRAISIDSDALGANVEQRAARARLQQYFEDAKLDVEFVTVRVRYDPLTLTSEGNPQLVFWPAFAMPAVRHEDELVFGWLHDEFEDFDRLDAAIKALAFIGGKTVTLSFPLRTYSKASVILKAREHGFYDLCWWCQDPKDGKPCGGFDCRPCRKDAAARWELTQPWFTEKKLTELD